MFGFLRRRGPEELPLSSRKPVDQDIRGELTSHLEMRAEELILQGWEPEAAWAEARRAFGDVRAVEAECRDITTRTRRAERRAELLEALWRDVVFGARLLRKAPGFTLAAVVTLALGIGANTAIFSVVNGILLRPLPYDSPDRLVDVRQVADWGGWSNVPWANAQDWRDAARSFDGIASYMSGLGTVLGADRPLRVREASVSQEFFHIFRVQPVRGRLPTAQEHRRGALPVALISWRFWHTHFNENPDLAALHVRSDFDYQVIGVLPPGFNYPSDADIWEPLELIGPSLSRTAHNFSVVARLRPGVTVASAQQELTLLTQRMRQQYLPDFDAVGAIVHPLQQELTGSMRRPLFLLLGASGLLLLLACTNLASTMLARGTARGGEFALRNALGAGRLRLVRQLFTESVLLAALGCVAGLALAQALLRMFTRMAPPRVGLGDVHMDAWVLGFTLFVTMATAVMIGLFPALRSSRADAGAALREGARAGTGPARQGVWAALVVLEVSLSVVLLCGSALLIRSFARVLSVDPGFRTDSLLTVAVNPPTSIYSDDRRMDQVYTRILGAVSTVPGVRYAGVVYGLPLTRNNSYGSFGIEGVPTPPKGYGPGSAGYAMVGGDYFRAMGIPILEGRPFDERDVAASEPVVVINQALADQWFRGVDPVGRHIRLESGMDNGGDGWLTIIGVVGNVRRRDLTTPPAPETYVALHQRPARGWSTMLVLRTAVDPHGLIAPVRTALARVAPDIVPEFATMNERLMTSESDRRFTTVILSAFAAIALVLSAVGIYGVVSYAVAQRTREIGVRIALGARPARVRGLVQQRAMLTVIAGLALGTVGALVAARVMRSLLYEIGAADPEAFGSAIMLLALAGWLSSWIPALRGSRVDPMISIRAE